MVSSFRVCTFLAVVITAASLLSQRNAIAEPAFIGQRIESFTLKDFRGKQHSLDELQTSELVVIAFLGTECPLAKLYGPRLADLHKRYTPKGVAFLAINANVQDSVTEMAAYARIHGVDFPMLKDLRCQVADQLGAQRTPEVFVLDRSRKVQYRGRIDNQYGIGYNRDAPLREDLATALDELLAGIPVSLPITQPTGCHIGRLPKPDNDAKITYSNRIAHILQQRCVECHRDGDIAPFALMDYDEVVGWAPMIEEVVREQRMPPWHAAPDHGHFRNDRLLSNEEKDAIYQWVASGSPEGDPAHLPTPIDFPTGWQLPREPDIEFNIQETPFRVQAEGEVAYQWFAVDTHFTEDKWLAGVEVQPGNREVVHHILTFVREPQDWRTRSVGRGFFAGYVPGLRAQMLPEGMAKLIPAGSQLTFQVHYTPIGSVQYDQSKIGLIFADPESVTHRVISSSAINPRIRIPAQESNHREEAASPTIPWDSQLLSMSPHMHLRGKSFHYEVELPNGQREVLLDVPQYDFNWQTEYQLLQPMDLPAGSRIFTVAHYDNSAANLNNPDPNRTVRWGDQSWDEMMIGYFNLAVPVDMPIGKPESELRIAKQNENPLPRRMNRWFEKMDTNKDEVITLDEVPSKVKPSFNKFDTNGDEKVSRTEFISGLKLNQ
ncbi:redoxin domain-containing protein [Neorhodopirellula lusitana]|uniref:redoxin domain-containing protein n=1 Tax=Neorhodopirellula lusitana TaxID=445327 RepID=UPI00384AB4C3